MTSFTIDFVLNAPSFILYHAWLTSDVHSKMTGGMAECSQEVGGNFIAWDGYISGSNLELIPGHKIVQSWRTTDFKDNDPDSKITLTFHDHGGHCHVSLLHENIPSGQPDYEQGWEEHYLEPMSEYFGHVHPH